jgi:tetratricopeptide (TPR) repeat protein
VTESVLVQGSATTGDGGRDVYARWQTLQLVAPVFEVINRAAPRAGFDHTRYDLAQLALRAIDFVVVNQASLDGSVSPARALDHLSLLARRMTPDDGDRPWTKVAGLVLNTLLNDGRPHEATWCELANDDARWSDSRTWRYRLLRLVDGDDGPAVTATDEAIVLYLQALNTDLADRAMALKLLVEIQMQAGEFEKALSTARQATRTAQGLSASLRDKLDDTARDVRSVDWRGEMPAWLTSVLAQLGEQIERDRQLKELAERAGENSDAAPACRRIIAEVRTGEEVWLRLERRLQQAVPVFLAAQEAQRFGPGGLALAIDLIADVLRPALGACTGVFDDAVGRLLAGGAPPHVRPQWDLDGLCKVVLRAPVVREVAAPVIDDPGELLDVESESIPDDVAAAAIVRSAAQAPTRLSAMLADARTSGVGDVRRLCDVVWAAALWTYVSGAEGDEAPRRADLAAAVTGLVAVDDGTVLAEQRYRGADVVVGTPLAFELADVAAEAAEGSRAGSV